MNKNGVEVTEEESCVMKSVVMPKAQGAASGLPTICGVLRERDTWIS